MTTATGSSLLQQSEQLLSAVARLNRWATARALASFDVPGAQLRLLSLIDQLGPVRTADLAAADQTSQPAVTGLLRRLATAGWTERVPDPHDARASLISLSPAGRAQLQQARTARARALLPVLDALDPADRAVLASAADLLDRLATATARATTT